MVLTRVFCLDLPGMRPGPLTDDLPPRSKCRLFADMVQRGCLMAWDQLFEDPHLPTPLKLQFGEGTGGPFYTVIFPFVWEHLELQCGNPDSGTP